MAPFAPNLTHRCQFRYRAGGLLHTITLRGLRTLPQNDFISDCGDALGAVVNAFESKLVDDWAWIDGKYSPPDDVAFYPLSSVPPAPTGAVDIADFTPMALALSVGFFGRGAGSFTSFKLYGTDFNPFDPTDAAKNGVVGVGESPELTTALAALNTYGFAAPNNAIVNWVSEATIDINDGWQKKARS